MCFIGIHKTAGIKYNLWQSKSPHEVQKQNIADFMISEFFRALKLAQIIKEKYVHLHLVEQFT
jgi:hypothetical protein